MFQPLELFIGLRYLRSRRWRALVSFRTAASLLGLALGVTALIVILSVLNGLETETRTRLLELSAHATVSSPEGFADWRELERRFASTPGLAAVTPYVRLEGMLAAGANLRPAIVRGILPDEERAASDLERLVGRGALENLVPGARRILLGRVLASNLDVDTGDAVNVLVPRVNNGRVMPRLAPFTVAGVIDAGRARSRYFARARASRRCQRSQRSGWCGRRRRAEVRRSVSRARVQRDATRRARSLLALFGLDRGVPKSLHGDAHREADDVDHSVDDRRRRGLQRRRVVDDGRHRQAEGHRNPQDVWPRRWPRRAHFHRARSGHRSRRRAARRWLGPSARLQHRRRRAMVRADIRLSDHAGRRLLRDGAAVGGAALRRRRRAGGRVRAGRSWRLCIRHGARPRSRRRVRCATTSRACANRTSCRLPSAICEPAARTALSRSSRQFR